MALIVQKFGGTAVGSVERIEQVADKVKKFREAGDDLVVVLSAMSGETNRLIDLARQITDQPVPRELDVIVSTGEQVTIALLAMALMKRGVPAVSYTGNQVRILTDSAHNKARILQIDDQKIRADLKEGRVVVVAGFQGVDENGNITAVHCNYFPDSKSGTEGANGYKVKGTIHWVSAKDAYEAEVRLYDRLFKEPQPGAGGAEFLDALNPDSKRVVRAYLEPSARNANAEDRYQFERHGYFVADRVDSKPGVPVFNRIVSLRDSWGKPA